VVKKKKSEGKSIAKDLDLCQLYQSLASNAAVKTIVQEWIESYRQNEESALLELTNFMIQACGSTSSVQKEDERDHHYIIVELEKEKSKQVQDEYPINRASAVGKGKGKKKKSTKR